jgi:hypothetical protein
MGHKAFVAGTVALGVILATALAFSQIPALCGKVVTANRSPAASAIITLRNRIANAGVDGSFCFQGIDRGEYDVVVQWRGTRSICHIAVTRDNLCVVPE